MTKLNKRKIDLIKSIQIITDNCWKGFRKAINPSVSLHVVVFVIFYWTIIITILCNLYNNSPRDSLMLNMPTLIPLLIKETIGFAIAFFYVLRRELHEKRKNIKFKEKLIETPIREKTLTTGNIEELNIANAQELVEQARALLIFKERDFPNLIDKLQGDLIVEGISEEKIQETIESLELEVKRILNRNH